MLFGDKINYSCQKNYDSYRKNYVSCNVRFFRETAVTMKIRKQNKKSRRKHCEKTTYRDTTHPMHGTIHAYHVAHDGFGRLSDGCADWNE